MLRTNVFYNRDVLDWGLVLRVTRSPQEIVVFIGWVGDAMGGEIFNVAVIINVLMMVGLGLGYLLLKLAPDEG